MTRRSLLARTAAAFAGSLLARLPLAGRAAEILAETFGPWQTACWSKVGAFGVTRFRESSAGTIECDWIKVWSTQYLELKDLIPDFRTLDPLVGARYLDFGLNIDLNNAAGELRRYTLADEEPMLFAMPPGMKHYQEIHLTEEAGMIEHLELQ
jgi:hypothetical protein